MQPQKKRGFTLIEMLLVLVLLGALAYGGLAFYQQKTLQTRIDRTAAQMQQILNAALSYYLANGSWPLNLACLQGDQSQATPSCPNCCSLKFLPTQLTSPWGGLRYTAIPAKDNAVFYVFTTIRSATRSGSAQRISAAIAGNLPLAYTSRDVGSASSQPSSQTSCNNNRNRCSVTASVNIPGDNINSARAVNFAGLYHNGGCVPVPQCPVDYASGNQMSPQIFVVPVSVSGFADSNNTNVYPISSFTAYARGGDNQTPANCSDRSAEGMTSCEPISGNTSSAYWRACLQVATEKGPLDITSRSDWGKNVTVLAITRCAINKEPAGSNFTVFQ